VGYILIHFYLGRGREEEDGERDQVLGIIIETEDRFDVTNFQGS
jgi:hypothetical protein